MNAKVLSTKISGVSLLALLVIASNAAHMASLFLTREGHCFANSSSFVLLRYQYELPRSSEKIGLIGLMEPSASYVKCVPSTPILR